MLSSGASERGEDVARSVVPFRLGQAANYKPNQLSVNDDQESVKAKGREGLLGRLTTKHKGKAPTIS